MNDQTPIRMTVEEFLDWAPAQDGRWELIDGRPVKMPSETFGHVDVKAFVWLALKEAIEGRDDLHVLGDGVTVRINAHSANKPDALIYSGPRRSDKDRELSDPLIVVEVASPTSARRDRASKRTDYFSLPTVVHYLVVDPVDQTVLHFNLDNWQSEGQLLVAADTLELTPPGLAVTVRRLFSFR